jgi:membrane-bound metal-dependent hydrolase YbcI (DUF457 family)
MFIGHHAVAFASKRLAPRASLGALVAAAMFLDLLWPVLVLLGVERVRVAPGITAFSPLDFESYPWSHSLLMTAVWSILCGIIYFLWKKDRVAAAVIAMAVSSHWLLDFITHRPDLPLMPGRSPRVGLGLWNSPAVTLLVEGVFFLGAVLFYLRNSRARSTRLNVPLWTYVIFVLAVYLLSAFAAPPPSPHAVAWGALLTLLFIPWLTAADRRREMKELSTEA